MLHVGANPNTKGLDRQTALTTVARHGNLTCIVSLLADKQTDINAEELLYHLHVLEATMRLSINS